MPVIGCQTGNTIIWVGHIGLQLSVPYHRSSEEFVFSLRHESILSNIKNFDKLHPTTPWTIVEPTVRSSVNYQKQTFVLTILDLQHSSYFYSIHFQDSVHLYFVLSPLNFLFFLLEKLCRISSNSLQFSIYVFKLCFLWNFTVDFCNTISIILLSNMFGRYFVKNFYTYFSIFT